MLAGLVRDKSNGLLPIPNAPVELVSAIDGKVIAQSTADASGYAYSQE